MTCLSLRHKSVTTVIIICKVLLVGSWTLPLLSVCDTYHSKTESEVKIIAAVAQLPDSSNMRSWSVSLACQLPTDEEEDEFASTVSFFINSQCVVYQVSIEQPCMYQTTTTIINGSVSTDITAKKATFPWLCMQVLAAHATNLYTEPLYRASWTHSCSHNRWVAREILSVLISLFSVMPLSEI